MMKIIKNNKNLFFYILGSAVVIGLICKIFQENKIIFNILIGCLVVYFSTVIQYFLGHLWDQNTRQSYWKIKNE